MSFWNLSDGKAAESATSYESQGGDIAPIPDGTQLVAIIEEAKWDSYQDVDFINLKWRVVAPAEYNRRVIYHKIKVMDAKPETADKAKRMLAAIDTNAGGKLMQLGRKPSDQDLMSCLMGKTIAIQVKVWELKGDDGTMRTGNWVCKVAPAKKQAPAAPQPAQPEPAPADDFDDDDVPF